MTSFIQQKLFNDLFNSSHPVVRLQTIEVMTLGQK